MPSCADGCAAHGTCNVLSGRCECPLTRVGRACETLALPACAIGGVALRPTHVTADWERCASPNLRRAHPGHPHARRRLHLPRTSCTGVRAGLALLHAHASTSSSRCATCFTSETRGVRRSEFPPRARRCRAMIRPSGRCLTRRTWRFGRPGIYSSAAPRSKRPEKSGIKSPRYVAEICSREP